MNDGLLSQTDLLQIVVGMQEGDVISFDRYQMNRFGEGCVSSVFLDGVRKEDIEKFMKQTSENWHVHWTYDFYTDTHRMRKL